LNIDQKQGRQRRPLRRVALARKARAPGPIQALQSGCASERPPQEGVILRAFRPEGSRVQQVKAAAVRARCFGAKRLCMRPDEQTPGGQGSVEIRVDLRN